MSLILDSLAAYLLMGVPFPAHDRALFLVLAGFTGGMGVGLGLMIVAALSNLLTS